MNYSVIFETRPSAHGMMSNPVVEPLKIPGTQGIPNISQNSLTLYGTLFCVTFCWHKVSNNDLTCKAQEVEGPTSKANN